ncbi:hypothetical protein DFH06DRAFT_1421964 [Mycena polygramma]|nr:hypothetical protein DFH06DRAFT_1421964 [Mycena polygramma]
MTSQYRVPNELWLEIAKNVPKYDRKTLIDFSLACRTFRSVSRPRLFAKFRAEVYRAADGGALLLPSPTGVDRRLERIDFWEVLTPKYSKPEKARAWGLKPWSRARAWASEISSPSPLKPGPSRGFQAKPGPEHHYFWSSPEIAPFVRSCCISTKDVPRYEKDSSEWTCATETPYILLDAVLERLARFTCLQRLEARDLHFTQARVDIISRLPPLSKLLVRWCTVAPHEHIEPLSHTLHVSEFDLSPGHNKEKGNEFWIPMLHPGHLRTLRARFNPRCMSRPVDIPAFPIVQSLDAFMDLPTPAQNISILTKFPAVRVLRLGGKGLSTAAVSSRLPAVFPHLREYSGPYEALPLFLEADGLKHVATSKCGPQDLISRIQNIRPNITSIHAQFNKLDIAAFSTLMALLPQLMELILRIRVSSIDDMFKRETYNFKKLGKDVLVHGRFGDSLRTGFNPSTFFIALPSMPALPPKLERLAILWECYALEDVEELCAFKVPDFAMLRDTVRAQCPGLKWLYLHGFYFMLEWRDCDGKVSERTAKNFMDGYEQSPEVFDDVDFML